MVHTVINRGAKADVRPYNFFLVRHKSRTKLKLYGIIYGTTHGLINQNRPFKSANQFLIGKRKLEIFPKPPLGRTLNYLRFSICHTGHDNYNWKLTCFSYFTVDLLKTIYDKNNHGNLNSISECPCNVLYQSEQKD